MKVKKLAERRRRSVVSRGVAGALSAPSAGRGHTAVYGEEGRPLRNKAEVLGVGAFVPACVVLAAVGGT